MHITKTNKTGCCYCYFFFCCCCCFVYLNIYCAAQWQIHKYTQTLENIFLPALLLLIHTWFLLFESEYSTPEHILFVRLFIDHDISPPCIAAYVLVVIRVYLLSLLRCVLWCSAREFALISLAYSLMLSTTTKTFERNSLVVYQRLWF